jgi:hypothetical protein
MYVMSTNLYLFKTHAVNISNLAVSFSILNAKERDKSHQSNCTYKILDNTFFDVKYGPLFRIMNTIEPDINFRKINWKYHNQNLEPFLNSAMQSKQILIFGSSVSEQLDFFKNQFGSKVFTIGINYDENLYNLLLNYMAKYHYYLLDSDCLEKSDVDTEILQLPYASIIDYYSKAFDQLNLIPKSSFYNGDYNINIIDFFSKERMIKHFNNINLPFTDNTLLQYNRWLTNQHNHRELF